MKKEYSIAGIILIDLLVIFYGKYFPKNENITLFLLIAIPFLSYWIFEDTLPLFIFLLVNIKIGETILTNNSQLTQWFLFNPFLTLLIVLLSGYKVFCY